MTRMSMLAGSIILAVVMLMTTTSRAGELNPLIPPEPISIMQPIPAPAFVPAAPAVLVAPLGYGAPPVWGGAPYPAWFGPTPPPIGYSVPVAVASPIPGLLQYGFAGYPAPGYPFRKLRVEYEWKRNGMYEVEYKFR